MRYLLSIITLIGIQSAYADEHTVTAEAFHIETPLQAVFLPSKSEALHISPEEWGDYTIVSLAKHGDKVKKGDLLIGSDTGDIDEQIATLAKSITTETLNLAQTQQQLEQLKITTPRSLSTFERLEREASENLAHYLKTHHALEIDTAKRNVLSSEFYLSSQQEELEQLLKMYSEDDKTEETEEMILKRARYYVDRAQFALKTSRINADHTLNTDIPRKLESKKRAAKDARIANSEAKQKLPRELQIKQQTAEKAAKDLQDNKDKLTRLKTDRTMMSITSPIDGIVYYGEIQNGKWTTEASTKILSIGHKLKAHTTLMTIIPTNTPLQLYSLASEEKLTGLSKAASGYASTKLNPYQRFPVQVNDVASYPSTKKLYLTTITATLPSGMSVVPGMKAEVKIISQVIAEAIQVPVAYLQETVDGGHSVQVKLADGKSSTRKVVVGASNKKSAVITQGLDKGQVIVK